MKTKKYLRGYNSAKTLIIGYDKSAEDLLKQARASLTNDDFDKGWKDACKEHI